VLLANVRDSAKADTCPEVDSMGGSSIMEEREDTVKSGSRDGVHGGVSVE
jgi:hypothetical protein